MIFQMLILVLSCQASTHKWRREDVSQNHLLLTPFWLSRVEKHSACCVSPTALRALFQKDYYPLSYFVCIFLSLDRAGTLSHSTFFNPWTLEQCLEQMSNFSITVYRFYVLKEEINSSICPLLNEDCAFAFQSCHQVPLLDLPARPPSSHFPLQFFLLSNRRVPLPLSSGPKAPLRPPAPVAMEMDSEVRKGWE